MDYAEFQHRYEEYSAHVYRKYMGMSEEELLTLIEKQQYDQNYQIWRAIGDKGGCKAIPILFNVVKNLDFEYLTRYHACDALFKISGINDDEFKGMVQYGRNKNREKINQKVAIHRLKEILQL